MSEDFLRRARMALRDMQGRVESNKLAMFEQTIEHAEALQAERDAAVLAEREACAAYCESHTMEIPMDRKKKVFAGLFCEGEASGGGVHAGMGYADAIRARSNKETK